MHRYLVICYLVLNCDTAAVSDILFCKWVVQVKLFAFEWNKIITGKCRRIAVESTKLTFKRKFTAF